MTELRTARVGTAELEFVTLECGGAGPLALCLHGFPDTARSWRHLLPALAEAGFHAVAPYTRGYHPTGPAPDGCYQLGALISDATALHQALGGDADAVLIGHDWGAMTAYGAGAHEPGRWRRLACLSVPPAAPAATAFLRYEQLRRSFYLLLFQTELGEPVVRADDFAFLARLWADWSPGYDATEDLVAVRAALAPAGCLRAALGYYRALFERSGDLERYAAPQAASSAVAPQPTLYLHGSSDGAFGVEGTEGLLDFLAPGSAVRLLEGAGHFPHLERPDQVNRLVVDWLTAP